MDIEYKEPEENEKKKKSSGGSRRRQSRDHGKNSSTGQTHALTAQSIPKKGFAFARFLLTISPRIPSASQNMG